MMQEEAEVISAARQWYRAQSGTRVAREDAYHRLCAAIRECDRVLDADGRTASEVDR